MSGEAEAIYVSGSSPMRGVTRPVGRWLALVGTAALGALFIAASIPKIVSPHDFALSVYRYHLLPDAWVNPVAVFLPWAELLAALCLLFVRPLRQGGLVVLGLMLTVFTVVLLLSMYRGINVSCGCFSVGGEGGRIGWLSVARNIGLLVLVAFAWRGVFPPTAKTEDGKGVA